MARLRPGCPGCQKAVPRGRLHCPHCGHAFADDATLDYFAGRATALAQSLDQRPWLRDGRQLPYVQRSLERGFLERRDEAPDPDLRQFLDELHDRLDPAARRLVLEYLVKTTIRPHSRPLAAYLRRLLAD